MVSLNDIANATCFIFILLLLLVIRPAHSRSNPNTWNFMIRDETQLQGLVADAPSAFQGITEGGEVAEAPEILRAEKHQDKSEAGGGVIVGGLVMAILVAVFCYIRVTRKTRNTADQTH